MTDNLGLVTKKELDAQVTVPASSSTAQIAKYIKIGTQEYKIDVDKVIEFEIVEEGGSGQPKADYDLTDAQAQMFIQSGSKSLLLKCTRTGRGTEYTILDTIERGLNYVDYYGSGTQLLSFKVNTVEKTAHFQSSGNIVTTPALEAYVVPSETVEPTVTAKSLKVGDTYWGLGASGDFVQKSGDTMTGPLTLGGTQQAQSYITATSELGQLILASPGIFSEEPNGTLIAITDRILHIGGIELRKGLKYTPPTETTGAKLEFGDKNVLTEAYIVNNLTTETAGKVLDAKQGKVLNDAIGTKQDKLTQMGSGDVHIYVAEDGSVQPGNLYSGGTCLTVNGVSKASATAGVFAPTSGGTAGQVLVSAGAAEPVWKNIVNDLDTTATDQPLSANMGKTLADRVESLSSIGRFLSIWNATTGKPVDEPPVSPYAYKTGDYYIVGTVAASGGTNYKPDGSQYVKGSASTVVESGNVKTGDTYYYTTTGWQLNASVAQEVSFRALTGDVADNTKLVAEFAKYAKLTGAEYTGSVTFSASQTTFSNSSAATVLVTSPSLSFNMGGHPFIVLTGDKTLRVTESDMTFGAEHVLTVGDIVNDLTTGGAAKALSAEQGKLLGTGKLDKAGGKITGNLVMAGGSDSIITTDNDEGLIVKSSGTAGVSGLVALADGEALIGTTEASLSIQTVEGVSSCTFDGQPVLTSASIVDDLTTGGTDKVLSAEQGKTLEGKKPNRYEIKASTATAVETLNGNGLMSIGGNLVAIGYDSGASKFLINGAQVASGTGVTIGSATLTMTYTAENKYSVTSTVAGVFIG